MSYPSQWGKRPILTEEGPLLLGLAPRAAQRSCSSPITSSSRGGFKKKRNVGIEAKGETGAGAGVRSWGVAGMEGKTS